jgi:hypothetical protein
VPLSIALTGPLAATIGVRATMIAAGTLGVCSLAGLYLGRRSLRQFDAAHPGT